MVTPEEIPTLGISHIKNQLENTLEGGGSYTLILHIFFCFVFILSGICTGSVLREHNKNVEGNE